MSNFVKRLILTLVAVPLVIFFIFWPQDTHIFIVIIFGIVIILGSWEINSLIFHKGIKVRRWFLPLINSSIYFFSYVYANNIFNVHKFKPLWILFLMYIVGIISFTYARDIFKKDLSSSFEKISYTLFGLLYIGLTAFLLPYIFNLSFNPNNPNPVFLNVDSKGTLLGSFFSLYFIIVVWSNDIFAYVFGMAFGRSNVIGLTSSPNKSWAGYIGGYFSTFFWVFLFYLLFDRFIGLKWYVYFIFPIISGIIVPIGDLAESVFKRSANVKDSGEVIMGRGGILDSVDTLLFVFPIYFLIIQLYFSLRAL